MPPFTNTLEFKQIFGLHNSGERTLMDLLLCNTTETAHFIKSEFDIVHTEQSTESGFVSLLIVSLNSLPIQCDIGLVITVVTTTIYFEHGYYSNYSADV